MDKQSQSLKKVIRQSTQLLDISSRRRLQWLIAARVSLVLMDLSSVALLSVLLIEGLTEGANQSGVLRLIPIPTSQAASITMFSIVIGLSLLRAGLGLLIHRSTLTLLAREEVRIGTRTVDLLFAREITVLRRLETPYVSYALTHGVNAAVTRLLGNFAVLVSESVTVLLLMVFGLVTNFWGTFCALLLVMILYQLVFKRTANRQYQLGYAYSQSMIMQSAGLREMIESIRELRSMSAIGTAERELKEFREQAARQSSDLNLVVLLPRTVMEVGVLLVAAVIGAGELLRGSNGQPIEAVGLFMTVGFRIAPAVLSLQNAFGGIRQASGEASSLFRVVGMTGESDRDSSPARAPATRHVRPVHGARITLKDVEFAYQTGDSLVLNGLCLEVEPGERIAIVGSSGSGKSTLIDVLLGLLPLSAGTARLDGLEPEEFVTQFPREVSYVPQQPALLRGSIRSNIVFGLDDTTPEDTGGIWQVLRSVGLEEFVRGLPDGLDSLVGESGYMLSGGQRQRIGIARALYRKPRLLILDEPTSALDDNTEQVVTNALFSSERSCTYLMVAHRLSTVQHSDRVLRLVNGRLYDEPTTSAEY